MHKTKKIKQQNIPKNKQKMTTILTSTVAIELTPSILATQNKKRKT